jgi:hypothetical protein
MILKTKKKKYDPFAGGANGDAVAPSANGDAVAPSASANGDDDTKKKSLWKSASNKIKNTKTTIKKKLNLASNKIKKTAIVDVKNKVNKCKLSSLLLGEFKCKSEDDIKLYFKNECTMEYITKLIKKHLMFKNEPDKIYIEEYFLKTLKKYSNTKPIITNVASMLECMNYNMSNIFMVFYKINTFKFDKELDTENYNRWIYKRNNNENYRIEPNNNNSNKTKKNNPNQPKWKSDNLILLEKLADFIVNVLIKSFIDYKTKFSSTKLKIENDFKLFLKSLIYIAVDHDNGTKKNVYNKTINNLYRKYNELFNTKTKYGDKIYKKDKETNLKTFKLYFIDIFNSKNDEKKLITEKLKELYKKYQDEKDSHTDQILSNMFDKNKSSKFLTIISGMLIFALLIKFDVFAAAPGIGSGTF